MTDATPLLKALAEHVLAPTSRQKAIAREKVRQELAALEAIEAAEAQKTADAAAYVRDYDGRWSGRLIPTPKWLDGGDA